MNKDLVEAQDEAQNDELNEEAKGGRTVIMLRVSVEERAHFTELGASAGFTSVSKFIIEAMNRYGDIIAKTIIDEDLETAEVRKRHRDSLRKRA